MMGSIIVCRKRRQTNNSQQYSTTTIIREQHLSYSTIFITFLLLFQCITLTSPKEASKSVDSIIDGGVGGSLSVNGSSSVSLTNRTYHHHPHHHHHNGHHHHSVKSSISHHHKSPSSLNLSNNIHANESFDHHPHQQQHQQHQAINNHTVDLYNNGKYEPNRDTSLLPLLPSESESHLSSSSSSSSSSLIPFHHDQSGGILGDPQLLPKNLDGSPIDLTNLNPKGLKFEEEPADSYIVRSKSAILRCKTLNALNAWFTCNSGDERKIQSNQKINNYVDPEKGIRMIEIDLEVTRTDVEEHTHSGYTNPFQCWCTAYGGQHQIMSRKASVSFSYLRKHFYHEPISKSVPIGSNQITFDCLPPDGEPKPTVFWMRNDVIIAETRSPTSGNDARQIGFQQSTKSVKNMKKFDRLKTRKQRRSTDSNVIIAPAIPDGATQHPEGVESFADPYGKPSIPLPTSHSVVIQLPTSTTTTTTTTTTTKTTSIPEGDDETDEEEYDDEDDEEEDDDMDVDNHKSSKNQHTTNSESDGGDLLPLNFDDPLPNSIAANYFMLHDYSLVIRQVTALDNANFTCGVRNQAGVRFSSPALLNVFVNGEWSNWGSWSECLLPNSIMCGRGSKKRVRHCSNPTPVNSGQFCTGDPVQAAECIVPCATVEGTYWSAWSQWSPCSHECTQVRRRVCNNPSPEIGANDCFGPDYMVKNCTGGLCRKLFDPNHSIHPNMYPSNTLPIGPSPVQPAPANNAYTNEQIYFAIIFLLTLIIVLCAMYIGLKFVNRRRHRGAKSGFHSATNGWGDMIQLERGPIGSGTVPNEEDAQAMLLLLQQQQGHCAVPANVQLPMSGPMSSRYQNRTQSQPSQKRSAQFGTNSSTSSTSSSGGAGEKYQLISRLKHNIVNSNKPNLLLDHLVMRSIESGHHPPPLPTIPSVNSLNSYATGHSSMNKYEEPIFPNQIGIRSPHLSNSKPAILQQQQQQQQQLSPYLNGKPPLPPPIQPTSALSNTSGSNNTATISTNTTNTSESENNESEPDYAEPMINYGELSTPPIHGNGIGSNGNCGPRPPSIPPPITCSTPLLTRSGNHLHGMHAFNNNNNNNNNNTIADDITFGKHEKFIKLTRDILERGHYSIMPNLGVGIYLTPGLIDYDHHHGTSSSLSSSTTSSSYSHSTLDLYLRYGIDTGPISNSTMPNNLHYCSLSSIVTVAFSRSPGTGPPPGIGSKLLNRPFVLCFKHCIAVRGNSIANLAKMLSNKNLTILWQDMADPHSQWIEVVRYGSENINTACYLEIDANNVYLITKLVGRYMLCLNMDVVPSTPFNHQSTMLANDFSKLINFSMTIEQFSNTEHLVKVYCYDDLPCSTLSLRNELSPSVGGGSNSIGSVRLRVGKNTVNSALRLSARGGPICFELKPPDSSRHRIKGMRRVEIPLNHIWYSINGTNVSSTTNMLIHCSFVVMNNHTIIRECTRKQCSNNEGIYENDNDDDNNDEPILVDDIDSDSDELVTEDDPESIVDDRPIRYINNNRASKHNRLQQNHQKRSNHHTNNMPMDHYHENENDLNYEVKIWQQPIKTTTNVSNGIVPISNIVLLNNSTTNRLCQPSNTASYYVERSIRHLFNETDRRIRTQLIEQLDQPRSDELDWRSFSSAAGFDHYMPFFATQPSPSTSIMELWEAKVLQQLTMKSTGNQMTIEMAEMKDIFYSKLVHLLQTIQRTDLIEIILSNQC